MTENAEATERAENAKRAEIAVGEYTRHLSVEATTFRWLSIPLWALAAVVFIASMGDLSIAGHPVSRWAVAASLFLASTCSVRECRARSKLGRLTEPQLTEQQRSAAERRRIEDAANYCGPY